MAQRASANLGELSVGIGADIQNLKSGLGAGFRAVQTFVTDVKGQIAQVESAFKGISGIQKKISETTSAGQKAEERAARIAEKAEIGKQKIEAARQRAEAARFVAEAARQKAEAARQKTESARSKVEADRQRTETTSQKVTESSVSKRLAAQERITKLQAENLRLRGKEVEAEVLLGRQAIRSAVARKASAEELDATEQAVALRIGTARAKKSELETKAENQKRAEVTKTTNIEQSSLEKLQVAALKFQGKKIEALELERDISLRNAKASNASQEKINALQDLHKGKIQQAVDKQKRLQEATEGTSQAMNRLVGMVQRMIGAFVIFKAIQGLKEIISQSFEWNKILEASQVGIAGLIFSTHDFVDKFGKAVDTSTGFAKAMNISQEAMEGLRKANLETAATLPELITMFQQMMAVTIGQPGADQGTITQLTKRFSLLGQMMQIPQFQMTEEIRSVFEGRMRPGQTRVASFFTGRGIDNETLRKWKEQGVLIQKVNELLKDMEVIAEQQRGTWLVLTSNLKDRLGELLAEGFRPLFEYVKSNLKTIEESLTTDPKKRESWISFLRATSEAMKDAGENAKTLGGSILNFLELLGGTWIVRLVGWIIQIGVLIIAFKGLALAIRAIVNALRGSGGLIGAFRAFPGAVLIIGVLEAIKYWKTLKQSIQDTYDLIQKVVPLLPKREQIPEISQDKILQLRLKRVEEAIRRGKEAGLTAPKSLLEEQAKIKAEMRGLLGLEPEVTAIPKPGADKEEKEAEKNKRLAAAERAASLRRQALQTIGGLKEVPPETLGASPEAREAFRQQSKERIKAIEEERDAEIAKLGKIGDLNAIRKKAEEEISKARLETLNIFSGEIDEVLKKESEERIKAIEKERDASIATAEKEAKENADLIDAIKKDSEAKILKERTETQRTIDDSARQFHEAESQRGQELADQYTENWEAALSAREDKLRTLAQMGIAGEGAIIELLDEQIARYEAAVKAPIPEREKLEYQQKLNALIAERKGLLDAIDEASVERLDIIADREEENFKLQLDTAKFEMTQFGRRGEARQRALGLLDKEIEKWIKIRDSIGDVDLRLEAGRRVLELQQEKASLSTRIWEKATDAIGNSFVELFSSIKKEGNLLVDFFRNLANSISNVFIGELAQTIADGLKGVFKKKAGPAIAGVFEKIFEKIFGSGGGTTSPSSSTGFPPIAFPPPGGGGTFFSSLIQAGATAVGAYFGGPQGALAANQVSGSFFSQPSSSPSTSEPSEGFSLSGLLKPAGLLAGSIGASLIGKLFGGGDKKKDPIRAQIKQWVSTELWPALNELKRLGFGPGLFGSFKPSGTDFFKSIGFTEGIPQAWLKRMQELAKTMKDVIGGALSSAFEASTTAISWRKFLREIRSGIANFIRDGMVQGMLRGSALTRTLAPFFESVSKLSRQFAKGKISEQAFASQIQAAFKGVEPAILALEPLVRSLAGQEEQITRAILGRREGTDLFRSIPGRFLPGGNNVNAPVTVNATINSPMDGVLTGQTIAYGIESELRRV